jgi:hypothetical protein
MGSFKIMKRHVEQLKILGKEVKFDWYDRYSTYEEVPTACFAKGDTVSNIYWYKDEDENESYAVEILYYEVKFSYRFKQLEDIQAVMDFVMSVCIQMREEGDQLFGK